MFDYLRDPQAIYRQSFATIEAEATLDRFAPAVRPVAVRIIHACGLIEIADKIDFGGDVVQAAQTALHAGKPVLTDAEMVRQGIISRLLPAKKPGNLPSQRPKHRRNRREHRDNPFCRRDRVLVGRDFRRNRRYWQCPDCAVSFARSACAGTLTKARPNYRHAGRLCRCR
jgi:hypothetical protein